MLCWDICSTGRFAKPPSAKYLRSLVASVCARLIVAARLHHPVPSRIECLVCASLFEAVSSDLVTTTEQQYLHLSLAISVLLETALGMLCLHQKNQTTYQRCRQLFLACP
jgi:hypothetical protein